MKRPPNWVLGFCGVGYMTGILGSVVLSAIQSGYIMAVVNGLALIGIIVTNLNSLQPTQYPLRGFCYAISLAYAIGNLLWNALHIANGGSLQIGQSMIDLGWFNIILTVAFTIILCSEIEEFMRFIKAVKTPFSDPNHYAYYHAYYELNTNYSLACAVAKNYGMTSFCSPERKTA